MTGKEYIAEMKEFASFSKATQRYIRRSLDVAFNRGDPISCWGRTFDEEVAISEQMQCYGECIPAILESREFEFALLVEMAVHDLAQERIPNFNAFRFLYERILGARTRPWLPMVYVAASASPELDSTLRGRLLRNISETAATTDKWSEAKPLFYPEWVEKVETPKSSRQD